MVFGKTFDGLVKKCLVGTTLLVSTMGYNPACSQDVYTPEQRAEKENMAFAADFLGALFNSGALPAKTADDARAMRGIGALMNSVAGSERAQLRNESMRYNGVASAPQINVYPPQQVVPQAQAPQPQLVQPPQPRQVSEFELMIRELLKDNLMPGMFICNYYRDFNGDKMVNKNEFVGVDKNSFYSNEAITLGVFLPKFIPHNGTKIGLKLYSPAGQVINHGEAEFNADANEYRWFEFKPGQFNQPGNYSAVFTWDGVFLGNKTFSIK